jgi:hypothetical protein
VRESLRPAGKRPEGRGRMLEARKPTLENLERRDALQSSDLPTCNNAKSSTDGLSRAQRVNEVVIAARQIWRCRYTARLGRRGIDRRMRMLSSANRVGEAPNGFVYVTAYPGEPPGGTGDGMPPCPCIGSSSQGRRRAQPTEPAAWD